MEEIERKVGRNILLFQGIEILLKFLLSRNNVEGYASELETRLAEQTSRFEKKMMGELAGQFNQDILSGPKPPPEGPKDITDIHFSLAFQIPDALLKESLSTVVSERNELVHHFRAKMDLSSPQGKSEAIDYLDQQYEKAQSVYNNLRVIGNSLRESGEILADFYASEAGQKYCDLWFLRGRRVMQLLAKVAQKKARPDGWTVLSIAGRILHQKVPKELKALKKAYGQRTLKDFVRITDWFEILEEPLSNGGARVLYREIPEHIWVIHDSAS